MKLSQFTESPNYTRDTWKISVTIPLFLLLSLMRSSAFAVVTLLVVGESEMRSYI